MRLLTSDNRAGPVDREQGFRSLIGVVFRRARSCCSARTGLPAAGPVVRAGRVGRGSQNAGRRCAHPVSSLWVPPTVTHGTLVTRSLHWCGTTGGAGLIIRREDVLKKNLISNYIYSHKTRFSISRRFPHKFFKGSN